MTDDQKEQKALLCVRSLANIAKDLNELNMETLANMCLFIANGVLQVYRKPEMPIGQVHGNAPHDTNIKNEILNVVQQVRAGFAQTEKKSDFIPEGGHGFLKGLNEKCCEAEAEKTAEDTGKLRTSIAYNISDEKADLDGICIKQDRKENVDEQTT